MKEVYMFISAAAIFVAVSIANKIIENNEPIPLWGVAALVWAIYGRVERFFEK